MFRQGNCDEMYTTTANFANYVFTENGIVWKGRILQAEARESRMREVLQFRGGVDRFLFHRLDCEKI